MTTRILTFSGALDLGFHNIPRGVGGFAIWKVYDTSLLAKLGGV